MPLRNCSIATTVLRTAMRPNNDVQSVSDLVKMATSRALGGEDDSDPLGDLGNLAERRIGKDPQRWAYRAVEP
jgi:hypothetical protein